MINNHGKNQYFLICFHITQKPKRKFSTKKEIVFLLGIEDFLADFCLFYLACNIFKDRKLRKKK